MESVEKTDVQPVDVYVRPDGTILGMYERPNTPKEAECAPEDPSFMINIGAESPESGDQVWQFPGWSESPRLASERENKWRTEQMLRVGNQLLMLDDEDPEAETGTDRQWRNYRIELRNWTDSHPDFPDTNKRPIAPA